MAWHALGNRLAKYVWVLPLVFGDFVIGLCVSAAVLGLCVDRMVLRPEEVEFPPVWPLTANQPVARPGKPPLRRKNVAPAWDG